MPITKFDIYIDGVFTERLRYDVYVSKKLIALCTCCAAHLHNKIGTARLMTTCVWLNASAITWGKFDVYFMKWEIVARSMHFRWKLFAMNRVGLESAVQHDGRESKMSG